MVKRHGGHGRDMYCLFFWLAEALARRSACCSNITCRIHPLVEAPWRGEPTPRGIWKPSSSACSDWSHPSKGLGAVPACGDGGVMEVRVAANARWACAASP